MKFKTELSGYEGLHDILKDLPVKVEKKILQRAVLAALRPFKKEFQNAAPRDDEGQSAASKEYGRGYRNIRIQKLRKTKRNEKGARVTTGRAFWLFLYERGTRNQPARPWFLPTFQRLKDAILLNLSKEISEGIAEELKK